MRQSCPREINRRSGNWEPTNLDDLADLVINAEFGPTLDAAVNGAG